MLFFCNFSLLLVLTRLNCFIIIMQRRNLPNIVKTRPKLVLERRPSAVCPSDVSNFVRTISISKLLLPNKQNEKTQPQNIKRYSFSGFQKEPQEKRRAAHRSSNGALREKSVNRSQEQAQVCDIDHRKFDYKKKIEDLIEKIIEKLKTGEGLGEGELAVRLRGVLAIILEESPKDKDYFSTISNQISWLIQRWAHVQTTHQPPQKRPPLFTISKCIDQIVYHNEQTAWKCGSFSTSCHSKLSKEGAASLGLSSGIVSEHLWREESKEREHFIFEHMGEISEYLLSQPNKILIDAFRRHKYLEEELFAYADLLSISQLGANTYTPHLNIELIQKQLDKDMRALNRELIYGETSLQEKNARMRNFILQVRQNYSSILEELMKVIDKKTEQAKTFVSKILKWEENYLTRKEYLSSLKKAYCSAMFSIGRAVGELKGKEELRECAVTLEESIQQIDNIYQLGNSFY